MSLIQLLLTTSVLIIGYGNAQADGLVGVGWNCELQGSPVDCSVLRTQYFDGMKAVLEMRADGEKHDFDISVSFSQRADGVHEYYLFIKGTGKDSSELKKTITPASQDSETTTSELLGYLDLYSVPFLRIAAPAVSTDAGVLIVLKKPSDSGAVREDDLDTNWFNVAGLAVNLLTGDVTNTNISISNSATYSGDDWKLQGSFGLGYRKMKIESEGVVVLEGEMFTYGGETVFCYSLSQHWNVAGILNYGHDPAQNIDNVISGGVGFEWLLIPFKKMNENTAFVRYQISRDKLRYNELNILNQSESDYFSHSLSALVSFRLSQKVQLSGALSGSSIIDRIAYSSLGGSVALNYDISNSFQLSTQFQVTFKNKYINKPAEVKKDNPYLIFLSNGSYSKVTTNFSLGFNFKIGNSTRSGQDQRFKH